MVKMVANLLDLIGMLQNKQLMSIGEHDSHWFPTWVKTRAFDVSTRFATFAHFCDFRLTLSKCCTYLECFVIRLVVNSLLFILMLENRLLTDY